MNVSREAVLEVAATTATFRFVKLLNIILTLAAKGREADLFFHWMANIKLVRLAFLSRTTDQKMQPTIVFLPSYLFDYFYNNTKSILNLQMLLNWTVAWLLQSHSQTRWGSDTSWSSSFFPAFVRYWFEFTPRTINRSCSVSGLFLTHMCKAYGASLCLSLCVHACVWIRNEVENTRVW